MTFSVFLKASLCLTFLEGPKFVINGTAFQLLFQRKHNSFRSKVAMGTATVDGVKYGPAKNMYRLVGVKNEFSNFLEQLRIV